LRLVALIVLGAMIVGVIVTVAFGQEGSSSSDSGDAQVDWLTDTPGGPAGTVTVRPEPTVFEASGFTYPIAGGCLPQDDNLMPGAPREYRGGIHEGVDFYDSDNCVFVGIGTEVGAAKEGVVIRADHDYEDLTIESLAELEAMIEQDRRDETEDPFRGRQVWIEHPDGSITRYCHLSGIVEDLQPGDSVQQGEIVGYVGESGTPESVTDPGTQVHLHFEIRIGESYLGAGFEPDEVRSLYEAAFAP